ncbi:DUF4362 domain-containing protein [Paenibacillus sp. DMB5]|uniref:DUF4362 domain-containing protein n=1 Tax=Paenibacillus sp. DMB5 TaxID=1780103 RepID=UPI00076BD77C|nr:DUF4362 domain-containing protein [Paenibacillus sp. DMB5]KUP26385.1 hypothetical protein AWJ19_32810 [Paenibacillus sp. DMB5]
MNDGLSHEINEQEDVVYSIGTGPLNLDRLDDFMERKKGSQRIIQFTPEGDPIFTEVRYREGKLVLAYDSMEDAFGPKETGTYTCRALEKSKGSTALEYTLTGCEGEYPEAALLWINYKLSEQDDFGFVLKYGVNRKNEINTLQGKLVKDLQDGTTVEAAEFRLPQAKLQSIYRELVLAGYVRNKTLTEDCNIKPAVSYELLVQMNGSERKFAWSECDHSADGEGMTAVAQHMISEVQEGEFYQALPETKGYYE